MTSNATASHRPDDRGRCPALTRFARDEAGSFTILALFFFVVMLMVGGLAVDLMIFENTRTRLQNLSDRAALAAADLDQALDPREVARDYFRAENLLAYVDRIDASDATNSRRVAITASQPMRTLFVNMVGVDELTAPATSVAQEVETDLEISLVLDNSGSMGTADNGDGVTRLAKLKSAVAAFLDEVYDGRADERISISVVPYSTQVNAGPMLRDRMSTTDEHDASHCVEFNDGDYAGMSMAARRHVLFGHFDQWNNDGRPRRFGCRTGEAQFIYPWGNDPARIMARVDGLTAEGQTSLDLGAKWGAMLLDPSTRPIAESLAAIEGTHLLPDFANRPYDFGRANSAKNVLLMTDGINTGHQTLRPAYRAGPSDMWYYEGRADAGIRAQVGMSIPEGRQANDIVLRVFSRSLPERGDEDGDGISGEGWWMPAIVVGGDTLAPAQWLSRPLGEGRATQQSWPQVWARLPVRAYAAEYVRAPRRDDGARDTFLKRVWSEVAPGTKDDRLDAICRAMKDEGVTVYTVGVHVNDHSRGVLRDCASSPSHFLDVTADELENAFRLIAQSITQLRLVQ